ncbi:MAG: ribosome maturation factor RimP [Clostridia bacterium]|nr:ribosome maturation factor RimP [Clostridia bacterium]
MTNKEKELEELLSPIVEELGYELYDIEYVNENHEWFVRLFIDNEKGIDLDDCEKVSNAVGEKLDEADPIPTSYSLEVSSCGLERRLREPRHYEAAKGKQITLSLFKPVKKKRSYEGLLNDVKEEEIIITSENEDIEIAFADISSAKILFNWEESKGE